MEWHQFRRASKGKYSRKQLVVEYHRQKKVPDCFFTGSQFFKTLEMLGITVGSQRRWLKGEGYTGKSGWYCEWLTQQFDITVTGYLGAGVAGVCVAIDDGGQARALKVSNDNFSADEIDIHRQMAAKGFAPAIHQTFSRGGWYFQIIDLIQSTVDQYIRTHDTLDTDVWFQSIMNIVISMQASETMHGDLHAENMCVLADGRLGMIDFGKSTIGKFFVPGFDLAFVCDSVDPLRWPEMDGLDNLYARLLSMLVTSRWVHRDGTLDVTEIDRFDEINTNRH